jgi:hypothetical protein
MDLYGTWTENILFSMTVRDLKMKYIYKHNEIYNRAIKTSVLLVE